MKKDEIKRKAVQMRIDAQVWKDAEEVLKSTGISRARYIEINLRALVKSQRLTLNDVMPGVVDDLFKAQLVGKRKVKKKT